MTNIKNAVPVAVSAIRIMFLLTTGVVFCVAQTASQPVVEPGQKMTNATVVQMVQAKISPDLIILSISKCEPHFQLDPANAQYMLQIGVTEEIYKAMAARQMGQPIPGFTQSSTTTAPAVSQPSQSPAYTSTTFQHKGSKEIGLQFTGNIPHAAPSLWTGFAELHSGYFVSRGSVVGVDLLGIFDRDAQDIYLSGYYRYYFHTGNPKFFPFFGGSGGGNIFHIRGTSTATNFVARGEAGVRYFVAKHVALDVGYNLVYIHVRGLGFKDSSTSQIGVGFSTVF